MTTDSDKIQKLYACCKDLGKAFKGLKQESDEREGKLVCKISVLETKLFCLETKVKNQDIAINDLHKENKTVKEKNSELLKHVKKCKQTEERVKEIEEKAIDDEELELLKDEIMLVTSKIESVEIKLNTLKDEHNHILESNKKNTKKVKCNHCENNFESYSDFEDHLVTENVVKEYKCNDCEYPFHTKWRLTKHMKNHTNINMKIKNCYYYNQGVDCPYEFHGCKFSHVYSKPCKFGRKCSTHKCQYRHLEESNMVMRTVMCSIPSEF